MEKMTINVPDGYEIDRAKSTDFEIHFKKIECKYPKSVDEIPNRNWYITSVGKIKESYSCIDINHNSTESRAKAFLALMQLVELRDAWNEIDGFVVDWESGCKYCIVVHENEIIPDWNISYSRALYFVSEETRDLFLETFKDLIEEAKELL